MIRVLHVANHERVAHIVDGRFRRLYGPGKHVVWTLFGLHTFESIDTTAIVQLILPGDVVPTALEGAEELEVAANERVAIFVDERLIRLLGPGRYRVWTHVAAVRLVRHDAFAEPVVLSVGDSLAGQSGFVEVRSSRELGQVLLNENSAVKLLSPGRYRAFTGGPWSFSPVPLSLQFVELAVQDVVTHDQIPVRLRPSVSYRVSDACVRVSEPRAEQDLYHAVQLALREVVAERTLDELFQDRETLSTALTERARTHLAQVGLAIERAAVKDVTLSAEVKAIVNRVAIARKEAEALAIRRREEVAATRQQANTAKVLAGNPVLLRLKELEAMAELADKIDKLVVVAPGNLGDGVFKMIDA